MFIISMLILHTEYPPFRSLVVGSLHTPAKGFIGEWAKK